MPKFLLIAAGVLVFLESGSGAIAQGVPESDNADRQQERAFVNKDGPLDRHDLSALSGISARIQLEAQTLDRVTGKMDDGLNAYETRPVVTIFTAYQKHALLPERTFGFLLDFMLTLSEESYVAADALQVMPLADLRRARAILALNERLRVAADDRETLYTIAYLERFQRNGPLNEDSVAALIDVAATRTEFSLRRRALDLARTQELSDQHKRALFDLLLREIVPASAGSNDIYSAESIRTRTMNPELTYLLQALVELSERPHPPPLIDLLVTHFPRYPTLGLPVFVEFKKTHSFSAEQQELLRRWATSQAIAFSGSFDARVAMRSTLIDLLWPPADAQTFAAAAVTLAFTTDFPSRCQALYDIRRFYGDSPLSSGTAASLYEVLLEDRFPELRFVGGDLLLNADAPFAVREQWLLELLSQEMPADELETLLLDAYDTAALQRFIAEHATDRQLPVRFRQNAIDRLESVASPGDTLPPDTENALLNVVLTDWDMTLGTAESALLAWGIEAPVSDRVRQFNRRRMAGKIADSLFLVLSVVSPLVFVYGLFAIPLSRSRSGQSTSGSVWLTIGWIVLGLAVLLAWVFGAIFSFGIHGGGAPPEKHFMIMLPFYLLSAVLLLIAVVVSRKLFFSRRGQAQASAPA